MGTSWKSITSILNDQFGGTSGRCRTEENVKDKYKSLGGQNAENRVIGEWSLEEAIKLIKAIEKVTETTYLKKDIEISFKLKELENGNMIPDKRKRYSKNKLRIYSRNVSFAEILDLVICENTPQFKLDKPISWAAVSECLQTKSSDDVRHYWNRILSPMLTPVKSKWTQEQDLALL